MEMETISDFLREIDNYSDCYGIWVEELTPESRFVWGQVINNSGCYLEFTPPEGWFYLGRFDEVIDARQAWHEGLTEFDEYFVDNYLHTKV